MLFQLDRSMLNVEGIYNVVREISGETETERWGSEKESNNWIPTSCQLHWIISGHREKVGVEKEGTLAY